MMTAAPSGGLATAEDRFHADMLGCVQACKGVINPPTYFLRMVKQYGGVATAKRLLHKDISDSFVKLVYEKNRPDLTAEAFVIKPQYQHLFTDEELGIALRRLGTTVVDPD